MAATEVRWENESDCSQETELGSTVCKRSMPQTRVVRTIQQRQRTHAAHLHYRFDEIRLATHCHRTRDIWKSTTMSLCKRSISEHSGYIGGNIATTGYPSPGLPTVHHRLRHQPETPDATTIICSRNRASHHGQGFRIKYRLYSRFQCPNVEKCCISTIKFFPTLTDFV